MLKADKKATTIYSKKIKKIHIYCAKTLDNVKYL